MVGELLEHMGPLARLAIGEIGGNLLLFGRLSRAVIIGPFERYIDEAGYSDRITIHLGPAVETVERLEGEFDFVFIDADKPNYVNYYEAVLPRLSPRGLIAADNTLWSGRVLDDSDDSDGTTAIRAFNEHVRGDDRVVSVMLTVRDGVTLIRRA